MPSSRTAAVIVAAGRSQRMGFDKLFYPINGVEVLRQTLRRFDAHPEIDSLVVVAGENMPGVQALLRQHPPQKPLDIVRGGALRVQSAAAGAAACPDADYIAIHDAARPFVSARVVSRALAAARQVGAAAPALPVQDTAKRVKDGLIEHTVDRNGLYAVQTPQCFERAAYLAAFEAIPREEYAAITDDCMVMERAGRPVRLVEGEAANIKITTPDDLPFSGGLLPALRVGHGYDVHRLAGGRKLILGGVEVPYEKGLLGHSDADVLLHAVADAILGAAALGDIGRHFPDSEPAYKDADSLKLLQQVAALAGQAGWQVQSLDATLLCQAPKLAPHIPAMRANIAAALGLPQGAVSVKATTEEGLGFTGAGQGIAAHCVVMLAAAQPSLMNTGS